MQLSAERSCREVFRALLAAHLSEYTLSWIVDRLPRGDAPLHQLHEYELQALRRRLAHLANRYLEPHWRADLLRRFDLLLEEGGHDLPPRPTPFDSGAIMALRPGSPDEPEPDHEELRFASEAELTRIFPWLRERLDRFLEDPAASARIEQALARAAREALPHGGGVIRLDFGVGVAGRLTFSVRGTDQKTYTSAIAHRTAPPKP